MDFNITLNENELNIIAMSLSEKPYGLVAQLIEKLNNQVNNQGGNENDKFTG